MRPYVKYSLLTILSAPLLAGCVTPGEDDPNAMTKQGAVGGALLGLTLGALTGDADLAVQGAIAGGVAGGVAGTSADIQNNRESARASNRDEAISQIGSSSDTPMESNWDKLDHFVGEWNVGIQTHAQDLQGIEPLSASGALAKTTQANVEINNEQGVSLSTEFTYTPQDGYQLNVVNNANNIAVNFAGERDSQSNRYHFYPTNVNDIIYKDFNSSDIHVELAFLGSNLWMLESYAFVDGKQTRLQTFRFTRS